MNLNEKIKELLGKTGLDVEQDEYNGNEDKYILFIYEDERPELRANNKVLADTYYLQIQLITPKNFNYMDLKKQIRNLLEEGDFTVYSIVSFLGDIYSGTEKTRQTVFHVEYTEGRSNENG